MITTSKSAIPLFIFVAIVILFLPFLALTFSCYRQARLRKQQEYLRRDVSTKISEKMPDCDGTIQMDHIQPPPPTVSPTRFVAQEKGRPLQPMRGADFSSHNKPQKQTGIIGPDPTTVAGGAKYQQPNVEEDGVRTPTPGETPFCRLLTPQSPFSQQTTISERNSFHLQAAPTREERRVHVRNATERRAWVGAAEGRESHDFGLEKEQRFDNVDLNDTEMSAFERSGGAGRYAQGKAPEGWI